jgi:PAS domain S-box-containing protein
MANVQWVNPAFEDLTGFKIDEIIGKNPRYFISSKKQSKELENRLYHALMNKDLVSRFLKARDEISHMV